MKNYDEVTNDLLERRDRYVAEQKKKRKRVMGVATSLCCFCLVALLGFGMWQGGMFNTTPPINGGEQTLNGDNGNTTQNEDTGLDNNKQNQGGQTSTPTNNDKQNQGGQISTNENNDGQIDNDMTTKHLFAINEITGTLGAAPKYRDPELHYNETWDLAKAIDYLGVDIPNAVAALPDGLGLKYIESNGFTVVYENNGTLVEDRMGYEFAGKDDAKVMVFASKLRIPGDCFYLTDTEDVTNIRIPDTDEVIPVLVYAQDKSEATMDYELYIADFEYNGIYYRIHAEHIREYNLDSLIREIVK